MAIITVIPALSRLGVSASPEEEFQVLDQRSQVPLGNLHLAQDLRELHCSPERETELARGGGGVGSEPEEDREEPGLRYEPKRRRRWCAPYR